MKKLLLAIVMLGVTTTVLVAQSAIRFNLGYALPLNRELIGEQVSLNATTAKVKAQYGSYGRGFPFQVGFSRTLKDSPIGFDFEAGYVVGKKYKSTIKFSDAGYLAPYTTQRSYARAFQFALSLTLTEKVGKFSLYSRMGPLLSLTKMQLNRIDFDGVSTNQFGYEAKGGPTLGFKGALGIIFNPKDDVQFFTEMNFTSLSCAPKEGTINELSVNGANILPDLTASERKISFKENYKQNYSGSPIVATRNRYSMGSVAFQIGFRFIL
jgi:hypothetical protein